MTRECNTGRQSLLMDIQKVDFMLVDLNLFLDTHPDCAEALQEHANLVNISQKLRSSYEQQYGSLMTMTWEQSTGCWSWIEEPWPWDLQ